MQEAHIELGYCYWRQGAYDEARVVLQDAVDRIGDRDIELRAKGTLRRIIVERTAVGCAVAFPMLTEASALFQQISNHTVKGGYHVELAVALKNLGQIGKRPEYIDRALVEYEAASYYFEQAGHARYRASVENNLGNLFYKLSRFDQADKHLDRAKRLFTSLRDKLLGAQTDETRATVLLAQGRNFEAERAARCAVNALDNGEEQALLCQVLTTHAVSIARLKRYPQAHSALRRAVELAEEVGDHEGAGRATLTMIEELGEALGASELQSCYELAESFLSKSCDPVTLSRLRHCAIRVIRGQRGGGSNSATDRNGNPLPQFIQNSDGTRKLLEYAQRVAATDRTALISGETGTGKEIMAKLMHGWSGRPGKFVALNCAALTETLFETELFGHKRGSFTDAVGDHLGAAREAADGTLFLDEVAELSPRNQAKLLRLVESGEVLTVGAAAPERVNVRILAATNRDLRKMIEDKSFRLDLYFRLTTHVIQIPALRDRREDIPAIARHLIDECTRRYGKHVTWSPESIAALQHLPLSGNAREMRSLIERTTLLAAPSQTITPQAVATMNLRQSSNEGDLANEWRGCVLSEEVRRYEGELIERALMASGGQITRAAHLLGVSHQNLSFMLDGRHQKLRVARNLAKRRKSILPKTLRSPVSVNSSK
ncbi:MAG: sigma 54-interacting transcriptional regulator [Pyrinomonadaceae bacterium]